jgi:hypothetical protein
MAGRRVEVNSLARIWVQAEATDSNGPQTSPKLTIGPALIPIREATVWTGCLRSSPGIRRSYFGRLRIPFAVVGDLCTSLETGKSSSPFRCSGVVRGSGYVE